MTVPTPKRRWFQYSLRTLLVLMVLVAVGMSWLAVKMQQAKRQRKAVAAIEELGGEVQFDWQIDEDGNDLQNKQPPKLVWLRSLLGDDFFSTVYSVNLEFDKLTDAGAENLKRFTQLRFLNLRSTLITDVGLTNLRGLTQLKELSLYDVHITDAGAAHLMDMMQLKMLDLSGTDVTDAGVAAYLKNMTQLEELSLVRTKVTDIGLERLRGLTRLRRLEACGGPKHDHRKLQKLFPGCAIFD